ncbi:AAA domain-containing protein [Cesiribacter andamanensis]|uniref:Putative DNA helicase n=1 Tax=Cesiribacter andamanensis AMV16 TaxID=1279009 RepID=M7NRS9_9BACT|nr:AAA domain-containing protein [Cesiribacter andamanensis]EMR04400.1 putative DNA helicase [Cesiribacter andamanensis AMV16]
MATHKPLPRPDDELELTRQLLKQEKKAEFEYYRNKVLNTSLEDRRKEGVCWYPIELLSHKISTGERYVMDVERIGRPNEPHVFTAGKAISLFVNDDSNSRAAAVVNWVKGNRMRFTLNGDDLPDWLYDGKLGIDLLFDEASYKAMDAAMQSILLAKGRTLELRDTLLGHHKPSFNPLPPAPEGLTLNEPQVEALRHALAAKDVAIIHGPPGTGKTTTLVQVIRQVVQQEGQVLVCAPSNAAVDLLADKLSEQELSVLRMGHPARVNEDNLPYTVDGRMASHPSYKELKRLRKKAEEMRNMAFKYKRSFGRSEREQRKMLLRESSSLKAQAEQLEYYLMYDIFEKTQVFCATLVGANGHPLLQEMRFKTLFIDEAGQALEPACWIPIQMAERVIFAGDHWQLPPTIKSYDAAREGLSETLFEKCITRTGAARMLEVQYRMHRHIMEFSSREFYGGRLQAAPSVAGWQLLPDEAPLEFVDTAGSGFAETLDPETVSLYNQEEARALYKHLSSLLERLNAAGVVTEALEAGIIAPYRAQVKLLTEQLPNQPQLREALPNLDINTVDAFQGQERDIMYISLVRSNERGEIGFLADVRRMNVALTRAKKKLVVLGDSATFGNNPFYSRFLDYVQEIGAYRSVFEWMYD